MFSLYPARLFVGVQRGVCGAHRGLSSRKTLRVNLITTTQRRMVLRRSLRADILSRQRLKLRRIYLVCSDFIELRVVKLSLQVNLGSFMRLFVGISLRPCAVADAGRAEVGHRHFECRARARR